MQISKQNITKTSAKGRQGAISAARLETAEAGMEMLNQGGNAVDAAVAAGFVAGVVEPMETTLAGSGFMLVHTPDDSEVHSIEFAPRAPVAACSDMYRIDESRTLDRGLGISTVVGDENLQGIKAAGVPATLTGLIDAHTRFGRLPLSKVLAPAIRLAYDGFFADSYFTLEVVANLSQLRNDPGARKAFLYDGDPFPSAHLGETSLGSPKLVRQVALGRTLERLAASGTEAVRTGAVGDELTETVQELGGIIGRDDLRSGHTIFARARRMKLQNTDVWGPAAPCGTITQHQILKIWSALYPQGGPQEDMNERLQAYANASWHAFADRYHWLADPDFVAVPEDGLLSEAYAAMLATQIRQGAVAPRSGSGEPLPWEKFASYAAHDPWAFEANQSKKTSWKPQGSTAPTAGTTHISVIDGEGMAVSLTHTAANHFGSKVVCERAGLLFDGAMGWFNARPGAANSIAGGKRPLANMAPMLLTDGGVVTAALGAPGGRRIINAVAQIALNLVECGMSAEDALAAPRIDASGTDILVSERFADLVSTWDGEAFPRKLVSEQFMPFDYEMARPVIVSRARDGIVTGATDPFTKGYSLAS
jgi:gamma-glutamyltranspeptidase/glutathione hydrolase